MHRNLFLGGALSILFALRISALPSPKSSGDGSITILLKRAARDDGKGHRFLARAEAFEKIFPWAVDLGTGGGAGLVELSFESSDLFVTALSYDPHFSPTPRTTGKPCGYPGSLQGTLYFDDLDFDGFSVKDVAICREGAPAAEPPSPTRRDGEAIAHLGIGPPAGSALGGEAAQHTLRGQIEAAKTFDHKLYTYGPSSFGVESETVSITFGGVPDAAKGAFYQNSASATSWQLAGTVLSKTGGQDQRFTAKLDPKLDHVQVPHFEALTVYQNLGIVPRTASDGTIVADVDCFTGFTADFVFDSGTVDRVGRDIVLADPSSKTGCIGWLIGGVEGDKTKEWTLGGPFFNRTYVILSNEGPSGPQVGLSPLPG